MVGQGKVGLMGAFLATAYQTWPEVPQADIQMTFETTLAGLPDEASVMDVDRALIAALNAAHGKRL